MQETLTIMRSTLVRTLWLLSWTLLVVRQCMGMAEVLSEKAEDYEMYENSTTPGNNSTTSPPPTPVLSAEAIANITITGAVIIFLVVGITILFCTVDKCEHQLRVKTALERNKQIDRQMAAEKRLKAIRAEEFRQKQAQEAATNVLQVQVTLSEDGTVRYEEPRQEESVQLQVVDVDIKETVVPTQHLNGANLEESSNEATKVVIIEEVEEKDKQLVNVSLDSYSPLPGELEHPPVVTVKPVTNS